MLCPVAQLSVPGKASHDDSLAVWIAARPGAPFSLPSGLLLLQLLRRFRLVGGRGGLRGCKLHRRRVLGELCSQEGLLVAGGDPPDQLPPPFKKKAGGRDKSCSLQQLRPSEVAASERAPLGCGGAAEAKAKKPPPPPPPRGLVLNFTSGRRLAITSADSIAAHRRAAEDGGGGQAKPSSTLPLGGAGEPRLRSTTCPLDGARLCAGGACLDGRGPPP